jgi:hypothetical protein
MVRKYSNLEHCKGEEIFCKVNEWGKEEILLFFNEVHKAIAY